MPIASRRKRTKQAKKKTKPFTLSNQHSTASVQLQTKGFFVSENQSKMEGNLNGTLEKTEKVEEESLSEDKDVAVEVSADDDFDGKSKSQSDTKDDVDVDVDIDEHVDSDKVVEETENVSETVAESSDAIEANQVENIVASEEDEELELKEEKGENFEVEQTELATSKDNNEVVETVKDMTVDEDENVLSSTDVVSISREVVLETSDPKSNYEVEKVVPPKGIEEQLDVQESSSYESAKESLQPSSNVVDYESNSVTEQDKIEESKGIENQGSIFVVTQRQQTSWKSCCGLFEILGHGDR
ncbi:uncharacterized protein LOC123882250 isoform X1 [Trifolium pratense]|uniref:uncharacterized protein LOC123882250 isoform X1 n=2 Tax=Trifolium pratense TaxID=57577 RepID=UPI001E69427A|nr:uncharacterized protein LOC123882250 isoform X1 [Trifolium pratense]